MHNSNSLSNSASTLTVQYDGTPDGCLCAISWVLLQDQQKNIKVVTQDASADDLFSNGIQTITTNASEAEDFYQSIRMQCGKQVAKNVLFSLLTMAPGIESDLLEYVRAAFAYGSKVDQMHHATSVTRIHRYARKVSHEIHRFKGLLRFDRMQDGRYMAMYEPDYDITIFLAWHFCRRLRSQPWIILDQRRHCAATWDGKQINQETPHHGVLTGAYLSKLLAACEPDPSDQAIHAQWKTFHRAVAIETRINPKLQKQCMPARYWSHLTEMQDAS